MRRTTLLQRYNNNVKTFLIADELGQAALLEEAKFNLSARAQSANVSYVGGVLFAGIAASLLIARSSESPRIAVLTFGLSVITIVIGTMPALSELFRQLPSEERRQTVIPNEQATINANCYAQSWQRVYHLQRNTFRFRWCSAIAGVFLGVGILLMLLA